jgi:hypothetical protein
MSIEDLYPDPNTPGLMVCMKDLDVLDPYRLPARQTEHINLPIYRPDRPLTDDLTWMFGTGIPPADHPGFPVFNLIAQQLFTSDGQPVVDGFGRSIIVQIAPNPLDLP